MNSAQFPVIKMEDPYCDVEVERSEGEQGASSSNGTLPYMSTFSGKHGGPASVTMFYPQLSGYDIHPLIINQRRRSAQSDKDPQDPLSESPAMNPALNNIQLKDARFKQKLKAPKRRGNELPDDNFILPENTTTAIDNEASDYSAKNRKSFYCRACGKAFKFQTSLLRHNNKVHISKYQCPTCNRVFSRQAYLDVHTSKQGSSCYLGK
ncbi:UNVERIFIED_CONTAM: hypothetical protein PYX00_002902 [Menopon gallinae]|uniref:C2H2-type domain-containing protein n=1 Tax=Menopon gallinae TaxID=328185 RepID=A0AAW2HY63_9NEOP